MRAIGKQQIKTMMAIAGCRAQVGGNKTTESLERRGLVTRVGPGEDPCLVVLTANGYRAIAMLIDGGQINLETMFEKAAS